MLEAANEVLVALEKRLSEATSRESNLREQLHDATQAVADLKTTVKVLRAEVQNQPGNGPYREFSTAPAAILKCLAKEGPSTPKQLADHLIRGGYQTESKRFVESLRVALRRMRKRGDIVVTAGQWQLPRT